MLAVQTGYQIIKILQYCLSFLSFLHNYFDSPTKLISNLYLAKFLDTLVKLSFTKS